MGAVCAAPRPWGCPRGPHGPLLASSHLTHLPPSPAAPVLPRRLISGMHSSITAHVVNDYLIDEATQVGLGALVLLCMY